MVILVAGETARAWITKDVVNPACDEQQGLSVYIASRWVSPQPTTGKEGATVIPRKHSKRREVLREEEIAEGGEAIPRPCRMAPWTSSYSVQEQERSRDTPTRPDRKKVPLPVSGKV